MAYKPKHKTRYCVICNKPFAYRENSKHKANWQIVRGNNSVTCSRKCARAMERLKLHRQFELNEAYGRGKLFAIKKIYDWLKDNTAGLKKGFDRNALIFSAWDIEFDLIHEIRKNEKLK